MSLGDLRSRCHTTGKRRYATRQAALRDAHGLTFVAGDQVMRAYVCPCGWWHLTRRGGTPLPAEGLG